jgi:hypothetical protein
MCTLTVIPRDNGYLLGMNRDERLTRGGTTPPAVVPAQGTTAIYPRDGEGGTWVAANDHGIALALLNWNDVPQPTGDKARSRGEIIPMLIAYGSISELTQAMGQFDLHGIWPFRLVGVFPGEKTIREWRWNTRAVDAQAHEWKAKHWFSSSLSDAQATAERGAVCEAAWKESDAGSVSWLRRLHASHANGPGPFSLCVHRESVGTLSYTEINCVPPTIEYSYFGDRPCSAQSPFTLRCNASVDLTFSRTHA